MKVPTAFLTLAAVAPLLAAGDGRTLFQGGVVLEGSKATNGLSESLPKGLGDPLSGSKDLNLLGGGAFMVFRLGEATPRRLPLALEFKVTYRVGSVRDTDSAVLFPAGEVSLADASLIRKTSVRELVLEVPLRIYFGSHSRWLEGPYALVGPSWSHLSQTVDFSANGSTANGPAVVSSSQDVAQSRPGYVVGLGWTKPVADSFFNVSLSWRRLNGSAVQASQRVTLALGWQF